ncbi:SRPBCC family protein [Streptomyces sp. FIT100]|uniref:SRPBCC family protein n=1 Tax=Streptomyces sp. FIT100 TaxID=2837956 RepID=UPI0021C829C2|nr:SRPBCC family protein [Streptomyces sp. FIT100]UUN27103.1 SRPBCC family protein [Streptomyces sp. FIT100]
MPNLEEQIDITAPGDVVWDHLHQVEDYPRFVGGVREARREGASGLHMDLETRGGTVRGIDASTDDLRPNETMTWRTTDTPHLSGSVSLLPIDASHTRVQVRMEYDPSEAHDAFGGPKGFAQSSAIERTVREDLHHFKDLVEQAQPGR